MQVWLQNRLKNGVRLGINVLLPRKSPRDGSLQTAVKYLEQAAMWSSKIDEEDKSIELLTRVKQIKDKAIKMRKQEAAEKAKKQYDKQQKAEVKQKAAPEPKTPEPKAPKAKVTKN